MKRFRVDQRRIKVLRSLKERCVVLKLDKRQGIVAVKKKDCYYSLDYLNNDPTKSEIFDEDPTLRNISTFHRCLNTLGLMGERTKKKQKKHDTQICTKR